jgi:hypothetical protein
MSITMREPRSRDELVAAIAEAAAPTGPDYLLYPLAITPAEAAILVECLEPPRASAFEGWADVELMGHRTRIAYVREIELAHRGFFELTWNETGNHGTIERREIYSPTAVFSITPLDDEAEAERLREARDDIPF